MQMNSEDFRDYVSNEDLVKAAKSVTFLPEFLTSTISCLGRVTVGDKIYIPRIADDNRTREGLFIPQSEQVCFSNLRETVLALANEFFLPD
jgi:hypothetical protein